MYLKWWGRFGVCVGGEGICPPPLKWCSGLFSYTATITRQATQIHPISCFSHTNSPLSQQLDSSFSPNYVMMRLQNLFCSVTKISTLHYRATAAWLHLCYQLYTTRGWLLLQLKIFFAMNGCIPMTTHMAVSYTPQVGIYTSYGTMGLQPW